MSDSRFLKMKEIPDQNMDDVFDKFYQLGEQLENKKQDDYANELVKLVTIIEQFFRCTFAIIFDEKLTNKSLTTQITVDMSLLEHIIELSKIYEYPDSRRYFKAHIVSLTYPFENVKSIEELQKQVPQWNVIKEKHGNMFELRHKIIHTVIPPHISHTKILEYYAEFEHVFEHTLDYFHIPAYSFHSLAGKAIKNINTANECWDKTNKYWSKANHHYNKALTDFKICLNEEESKNMCRRSIVKSTDRDITNQNITDHLFSTHYEMAWIYYLQANDNKALEHLNKALEIKPNDPITCFGKYCIFRRKQDKPNTEKWLLKSAQNGLLTFDICRDIVIHSINKNQLDEYLEWTDRCIYAHPEDPRTYLIKYDLLLNTEMKNWAKSCMTYAKLLSDKYLNSIYVSQKNKDECKEMLQERI